MRPKTRCPSRLTRTASSESIRASSAMSAPATNARFPAPVRITARTPPSGSRLSKTSASSRITSALRALSFSWRSIVTTASSPSHSTRMCSRSLIGRLLFAQDSGRYTNGKKPRAPLPFGPLRPSQECHAHEPVPEQGHADRKRRERPRDSRDQRRYPGREDLARDEPLLAGPLRSAAGEDGVAPAHLLRPPRRRRGAVREE